MARLALFIFLILMSLTAQTSPYTAERTTQHGTDVIVLRDAARQAEVRIAPAFGNNAYEFTVNGKRVFWSPASSLAELQAKPAHAGNPFLWPWANRIDGMSYFVQGRKYHLNPDLGNVRPGPRQTPIHGLLVYDSRWQVQQVEARPGAAVAHCRLEFSKYPDLLAQFPFAHSVDMIYRLRDGELEVETVLENQGATPLPVSLGYHPYFQVNDAPRDEWTVTLPVETRYQLSDRLIPTGETSPAPYPQPLRLQGVVLDDVFGGLRRDTDGFARFSVQGKQERITVAYGPKYTVAVVYAPAGRGFICFEPMTAITNAFNAAHAGWYKDLQFVPPGGTWREVFRVKPEGY